MKRNKINDPKATRQQLIDKLLAELPEMERRALLKLWCDLFGRMPNPGLRRETLIPILAYRIQEKAFGGLKESTARKLRELAAAGASAEPILRPKTGTRYVREYNGMLHEVTVLEAGYEYEGTIHRSLTEIAKIITGTKWSGPAFFGQRPGTRRAAA